MVQSIMSISKDERENFHKNAIVIIYLKFLFSINSFL